MAAPDLLLPGVYQRFKFVLPLVSLDDQLVLVQHRAFGAEKLFNVLGAEGIESVALVLDLGVLLLLGLLDVELFLHLHLLRFALRLLSLLLFPLLLLLGDLRLLEPLFNKTTLLEGDKAVLVEPDLE